MNVEVTTVGRKPQRAADVATAIFVITGDDIRRSGATTLPEVLRLAPGVHVAQIDANKWAVTARGFNGRFANKLLVLIDGRTVYTPLFSGVFWDVEDLILEDVQQIEVIRGPGASVWGANAVNGVINIITKHAQDTQGMFATAVGGSEERALGSVRYGGALANDKGHYRLYGKYFDRDGSVSGTTLASPYDAWSATRAGVRFDIEPSVRDTLDLHANLYSGRSGETVFARSALTPIPAIQNADQNLSGVNVLTRWARQLRERSTLSLQASYSRTSRDTTLFQEERSLVDVDFQHRLPLGTRHDFSWGGGYEKSFDEVGHSFNIMLDPASCGHAVANVFVQNEMTVVPDRLFVTLGAKLERYSHHDRLELQPSARLLWKTTPNQSVWLAASRAVRTPSRAEEAARIQGLGGLLEGRLAGSAPSRLFGLPVDTQLWGSGQFGPESLIAYEAGYRAQASDQLSVDAAVYYNDYSDLRFLNPGPLLCAPQGVPVSSACLGAAEAVVLPWLMVNAHRTHTYGLEATADWRPREWFRLQPTYTFFGRPEHNRPDQALVELSEGQSPTHQWSLRQSIDVGTSVRVDGSLRYVGELPFIAIDPYTSLDARVSWSLRPDLELAVVGRNLLESRHAEFVSEIGDIPPIEIERSAYVTLSWGY